MSCHWLRYIPFRLQVQQDQHQTSLCASVSLHGHEGTHCRFNCILVTSKVHGCIHLVIRTVSAEHLWDQHLTLLREHSGFTNADE